MFQLQNEYSYEDSIALAIAEEELEEYIESFNSVMKDILSRSSSDLTTVSCAAKCHTINMLCGMAKKFIKSFGIRNQIGSNGLIDPSRVGRSELDGFYMSTTEYLSKELSGLLIKDVILIEEDSKKIKDTKTYLMNQWEGIEAHDKYKDKLTGCCQEGQVHHTLSERLSTDAKVWSENGIDEMSQLRAFTQNGGDIYQKIVDISTEEKREKKIQELEKRIRKKANKKLFGTTGAKIPIARARDELYYELKNIWYGNAV